VQLNDKAVGRTEPGKTQIDIGGLCAVITILKPSGHYMCHQVLHSTILRSAHAMYLRVLCGSDNKQLLFPYTTLTDWYL